MTYSSVFPPDLGAEDQAFARPSRGLVGRAQFRHHRVAGEPVLEPRLELCPGGGQVALRERDACHATTFTYVVSYVKP